MAAAHATYTVSELTRELKALIEGSALRTVFVEGEVSGWRIYPSGHAYFALKDEGAVLNAVMFASARARLDSTTSACLADGAKVKAWGQIDVYPPRGSYQLVVRQLWAAGAGDLAIKFEKLKKQLAAEGLFDALRKKPLPYLPHHVGVVTSPAGAVIHDMATVLTRRFPNLRLTLFPAKVQGVGAAETIVAGIRYFNSALPRPDLLIVARGGGSTEDLWCFNEESVVRAVAASEIPVVSAVGHETDYTLCDFAADVRAGTPSIAAELAVPVKAELSAALADMSGRLARAPARYSELLSQKLDHAALRLSSALRDWHSSRAAAVRDMSTRLRLLDPYSVLKRGYSITTIAAAGKVIRTPSDAPSGTRLVTRLAAGEVESVVS